MEETIHEEDREKKSYLILELQNQQRRGRSSKIKTWWKRKYRLKVNEATTIRRLTSPTRRQGGRKTNKRRRKDLSTTIGGVGKGIVYTGHEIFEVSKSVHYLILVSDLGVPERFCIKEKRLAARMKVDGQNHRRRKEWEVMRKSASETMGRGVRMEKETTSDVHWLSWLRDRKKSRVKSRDGREKREKSDGDKNRRRRHGWPKMLKKQQGEAVLRTSCRRRRRGRVRSMTGIRGGSKSKEEVGRRRWRKGSRSAMSAFQWLIAEVVVMKKEDDEKLFLFDLPNALPSLLPCPSGGPDLPSPATLPQPPSSLSVHLPTFPHLRPTFPDLTGSLLRYPRLPSISDQHPPSNSIHSLLLSRPSPTSILRLPPITSRPHLSPTLPLSASFFSDLSPRYP